MRAVAVLALTPVGAPAAAAGRLGEITWSAGAATEIRIPVAGGFTAEDHQGGDRIVIDLHNVRPATAASKTYRVAAGAVEQIRVGDHPPATVRVVIDLAAPATYTAIRSAAGLTIRVTKTAVAGTPAAARRHQGGGLKVAKNEPKPRPVKREQPAAPAAPASPPEVVLDPGLELNILDDTAQDMPYILRMYHGHIGFGVAGSPTLEMLYAAPDWQPAPLSEENNRPGRYFALQFTDEKSTVVAALRQKYGIPGGLAAYALFPKSFTEALHQEILDAAARQGRSGKVTAATILFTMLNGRGVEVKNVTVAAP